MKAPFEFTGLLLWLINLVCPKIYIKFNLICLNINFDLISFVRV